MSSVADAAEAPESKRAGHQLASGPLALRVVGTLALQPNHQRGAAVQAARFFARVVVLRPLLAVADGVEAGSGNPAARQVLTHGIGAALAEGQVVFGRADVARMTFDLDAQVRVLLHRLD